MKTDKYLLWLDLPQEEKEYEIMWRELYTKIGCIIHNAQLLEYNLCIVLIYNRLVNQINSCNKITMKNLEILDKEADELYNKLNKMTMGQIASNIDEVKKINKEHKNKIKDIIRERNEIVHNMFKNRLKSDWFKDYGNIDKLIEQYNSLVKNIVEENKKLLNIIKIFKRNTMKLFS